MKKTSIAIISRLIHRYMYLSIYHLNKQISISIHLKIQWKFDEMTRLLVQSLYYSIIRVYLLLYPIIFRCVRVFESHISMRMRGTFRVSHGTVPCVALLTADQFLQSNAGNESFISFCLINQFHAFVLRVYPQRNECK